MAYTPPSDRTIDWTYAGVPGGIPNYTVKYGPTLSPLGGTTNDAPQINAAIAAASAVYSSTGVGQVVELSAGTFIDTSYSQYSGQSPTVAVSFNYQTTGYKGVVVRGAGPGATILRGVGVTSSTGMVKLGNNLLYAATRYDILGDVAKGATTLVLASPPPSACTIGGLVMIDEVQDINLQFSNASFGTPFRAHHHKARVTAINGTTISFTPPVDHEFQSTLSPQARFTNVSSIVSRCGIENLTLDGVSGTDCGLLFNESDQCWAKKVEVKNVVGTTGIVKSLYSLQTEVNMCYVHDAIGYPSNTDGYAIYMWQHTVAMKIENCITDKTASGIMGGGNNGCYVGYNYMHRFSRGVADFVGQWNTNHWSFCTKTLWEGNSTPTIETDGYHGNTTHQMYFRNNIHGIHPDGDTGYRELMLLARGSFYHTAIGNVFGHESWTPTWYEYGGGGMYGSGSSSSIYRTVYPNDGNDGLIPPNTWPGWTVPFPDYRVRDQLLKHGNYIMHSTLHTSGGPYSTDVPGSWPAGVDAWADADHDISASMVYGNKPAFFGTLDFPAIGPDVAGYVKNIPAVLRWANYAASGYTNLAALFEDVTVPPGPDTLLSISGAAHSHDVVNIILQVGPSSDFSLAAVPVTRTVSQHNEAIYVITSTSIGTFNRNITLSVTGLPVGCTASFSINPIGPSGSSTLTINTSNMTGPVGTYTVTVRGDEAV